MQDTAAPAVTRPVHAERDRPLAAVLFVLAAAVVIPVMDGVAKSLSARYPVAQVVWARYFFHALLLFPVVLVRYGRHSLWPHRPVLQLTRGALLLASTGFFFAAIAHMPLADALALVFVSPLVVTALSPFVLGEHVGARRWAAVVVGFIGACIIIRPGFGVMQWASLLALGAGTGFACYVLATRKLSGSGPPLVTLAHTALVGAAVTTLIAPATWVTPTPADWVLMVVLGVLAATGHFFIIQAYERAPASLLAPYGYGEIVTATLVGYVAFGDFPDAVTWVGITVVIASGVYISVRERRAAS